MTQVNIHEAKTHLSKLIRKAVNGEEVVIARGNVAVAKLVGINSGAPKRVLGTARGLIVVSDDFDAALEDMVEYS